MRQTAKNRAPQNGKKAAKKKTCPIRDLLARIGDKWSLLTMNALAEAEDHCLRFSELMREIGGISQRMLTTTLRALERDGILTRRLYPEVPPRVEYKLTTRGQDLMIHAQALICWIESSWPEIEKSRAAYDKKNGKEPL